MNPLGYIQINSKAEINIVSEGMVLPFACEVKGITTDSVLLTFSNELKALAETLKFGQQIEMMLYLQNGVVVLTSNIKETVKTNCIVIDYPREKKIIQRREFFRVGIQRPIDIFYNDGYKEIALRGKTIDISGGGVRFWTLEHVRVGFMAEIKLFIGDLCEWDEPVAARGRILYTKAHDSLFATKPGYISVIKFYDIQPKARQLVMKACFKVQIDMRKKGLI